MLYKNRYFIYYTTADKQSQGGIYLYIFTNQMTVICQNYLVFFTNYTI